MARASARIVLNRSKLDDVRLILADGLFEVGRTVVEFAAERAPDSPYDPYPAGEGLPRQGGVLAYVDNQKIDGWSQRGGQPAKPRAARPTTRGHSIAVIAGFGFPARLANNGTIRTPARPFFSAAAAAVAPHVVGMMGDFCRGRIGGK